MRKSAQHSMAAHVMHSRNDGREVTENARRAAAEKRRRDLIEEIDPFGELPADELHRRIRRRERTHFSQLSRMRWKKYRQEKKRRLAELEALA